MPAKYCSGACSCLGLRPGAQLLLTLFINYSPLSFLSCGLLPSLNCKLLLWCLILPSLPRSLNHSNVLLICWCLLLHLGCHCCQCSLLSTLTPLLLQCC